MEQLTHKLVPIWDARVRGVTYCTTVLVPARLFQPKGPCEQLAAMPNLCKSEASDHCCILAARLHPATQPVYRDPSMSFCRCAQHRCRLPNMLLSDLVRGLSPWFSEGRSWEELGGMPLLHLPQPWGSLLHLMWGSIGTSPSFSMDDH